METLKQILIWQLWLVIAFCASVLLLVALVRTRNWVIVSRPSLHLLRQRLLPSLLFLSFSLLGLGGSLIALPYDFLDLLGGVMCMFGIQLAYSSIIWAASASPAAWLKENLRHDSAKIHPLNS